MTLEILLEGERWCVFSCTKKGCIPSGGSTIVLFSLCRSQTASMVYTRPRKQAADYAGLFCHPIDGCSFPEPPFPNVPREELATGGAAPQEGWRAGQMWAGTHGDKLAGPSPPWLSTAPHQLSGCALTEAAKVTALGNPPERLSSTDAGPQVLGSPCTSNWLATSVLSP